MEAPRIITENVLLALIAMLGPLVTAVTTWVLKKEIVAVKQNTTDLQQSSDRREVKLDEVHQLVNGNLTKVQDKLDVANKELQQLKISNESPTAKPPTVLGNPEE